MKDEVAVSRLRILHESMQEKGVLGIARLIAIVFPIAHLILSPIHVSALLKLENEICGFVMFASILLGLVVLFEASRISKQKEAEKIMLCLFMALDSLVIISLIWIYHDALFSQATLKDPGAVVRAVILSWTIIGSYIFAFVLTVISMITERR